MVEWRYSYKHNEPRHQMEVKSQLHALAPLTLGKSTWYPLSKEIGGPQS